MLESEVELYLKKKCEALGWMCAKTHSPANSGFPDRTIIADGRVVFVELKRPGGKPRKLQMKVIARIRKAGGEACVVDCFERADALIDILANDLDIHAEESNHFLLEI